MNNLINLLKKGIILLIVFFCMLTPNVFAQESEEEFLSSQNYMFYGQVGKTIYVPITLYDFSDTVNNSLILTYDESKVELVDLIPYKYGHVLNEENILRDSNGKVIDTNVYRYMIFTKVNSGEINFDVITDRNQFCGVAGIFKFRLKDTSAEFTLKRRNNSSFQNN